MELGMQTVVEAWPEMPRAADGSVIARSMHPNPWLQICERYHARNGHPSWPGILAVYGVVADATFPIHDPSSSAAHIGPSLQGKGKG